MKKIAIALPIVVASACALAFDMNPIDVDCWGNGLLCKPLKLSEKAKFPVHETLTLLAYDYYLSPDSSTMGAAKTSAAALKKAGVFRDLVIGSEWNDDPDSLLRQDITQDYQWYALFQNAKVQAECKKQVAPKCAGFEIASNPMMLYRSHFGDLQFLHSMASRDDEPAEVTKRRMMAWAKFTYGIFVSTKNLEKTAIDSKSIPWFADVDDILKKPGWTVGALFDPVPGGEWKASYNPLKTGHYESSGKPRQQNSYAEGDDRRTIVKFVALGSLLHMVQDSYSDSHTERQGSCNPIAKRKQNILSFRNYASQNTADHAIADALPEWLKYGELKTENALWASAHLIQFAFDTVPWEKGVEQFLDKEVFPLLNPQQTPTIGDRDCYLGST